MAADDVRIVELDGDDDAGVHELLVDLLTDEQQHYDHPRESRDQLSARLSTKRQFTGENHVLVARDAEDAPLGLCWVVLFDPGTGLEAEIAELYVRPQTRRAGIARRLLAEAMALIQTRAVTFASVWTRDDNPAATAVYEAAGFRRTEQVVLTWLPV